MNEINQCDGCQIGLPTTTVMQYGGGSQIWHTEGTQQIMRCTKERYQEEKHHCEVCDSFECTCSCKCGLPHDQCVCGFTKKDFEETQKEITTEHGIMGLKQWREYGEKYGYILKVEIGKVTFSVGSEVEKHTEYCFAPKSQEETYECPICKTGYVRETFCGSISCRNLENIPIAKLVISSREEVSEWSVEFEELWSDAADPTPNRKIRIKEFIHSLVNQTLESAAEKEIVICSAVKAEDGYIARGHRHADCLRVLEGMKKTQNPDGHGFMTSKNRWVSRNEAYKLQVAAGIESHDKQNPYLGDECYSEDLY